ncbi:MAG: T9SS type A sorting domain-containing protein [Bacteroidetes bacterium]|nr:T9SS type A sorting domain-containing protein [Bacteroidota bacterium]
MPKKILYFLLALLFGSNAKANILNVPANFANIQLAIIASADGDTVLVEPGTYFENINLRGKKILLTSRFYELKDTGFICSTIINGSQPTYPDSASCITINTAEDSTTIIQGFTITGGAGTKWTDEHGAGNYREGGGILIAYASPTIRNNHIINNWVTNTLTVASTGGGGVRCGDGHPHIYNNVIAYNKARYGAGIVFNHCTNALLKNNVIAHNSGGQDYGGGGVWTNYGGLLRIENNTIAYNHVSGTGTFGGKAGGICVRSNTVNVKNNIVWGNSQSGGNSIRNFSGTLTVSYTDVDYAAPGIGNINIDPLFIDTAIFSLSQNSPCIDKGDSLSGYDDLTMGASAALYPSLGTNRNDIGAYGGKLAQLIPPCALLSVGIKSESIITDLKIYPNPAVEYIQIESFNQAIFGIEIINANGILVKQIQVNQSQYKLDTQQFSTGIYVLKLIFSDHVCYQKIVIN